MKIWFVRLFCVGLIWVFHAHSRFLLNLPELEPEFVSFARIFDWLPFSQNLISMLSIAFSLSLIVFLIKPSRTASLAIAALFLPLIFVKYSYGKISHSSHIFLVCTCLLPFFDYKKPGFTQVDQLVLKACQALILAAYFSAGLWKVRSLWGENIMAAVNDHIAYAIAEGGGPPAFFSNYSLLLAPEFVTLGFALALLFQLSAFTPLVLPRLAPAWGIMAAAFHMSTGVYLDIYFWQMGVTAVLFLFVGPAMIKNDSLARSTA